jgi:hypothetical protein
VRYFCGMREATVLVVSAIAMLVGIGLGCMARPKPAGQSSVTQYDTRAPNDSGSRRGGAVTKVVPAVAPSEPVDANSTPEAVQAWRRKDKDEIEQRVDRLSASDAENLCFELRLIPRDEVFDKINVKGRLKRYVDGLRTPEELTDVESAFHEIETHQAVSSTSAPQ